MDRAEIKEIARLVAAEIVQELQQYEIRHTIIGESDHEIVQGYYTVEPAGSSYEDEMIGRADRKAGRQPHQRF